MFIRVNKYFYKTNQQRPFHLSLSFNSSPIYEYNLEFKGHSTMSLAKVPCEVTYKYLLKLFMLIKNASNLR